MKTIITAWKYFIELNTRWRRNQFIKLYFLTRIYWFQIFSIKSKHQNKKGVNRFTWHKLSISSLCVIDYVLFDSPFLCALCMFIDWSAIRIKLLFHLVIIFIFFSRLLCQFQFLLRFEMNYYTRSNSDSGSNRMIFAHSPLQKFSMILSGFDSKRERKRERESAR